MLINFLIAIFFVLFFWGFPIIYKPFHLKQSVCHEDVLLSFERTNAIKGIAAIMIVFAHMFSFGNYSTIVFGGGITQRIIGIWGGLGVALFFFLSGYGCYFSIKKITSFKEKSIWLLKHIIKLLIYYFIVFVFVELLRKLYCGVNDDWFTDLIFIRIPGSTTWYLKIQILMYVLIFISSFISKYEFVVVFFLALLYSVVVWLLGFQDFWWKTVLCFPAGVAVAANSKKILYLIKSKFRFLLFAFFVVLSLISIIWILIDGRYFFPLQLISFVGVALGLAGIFEIINYNNCVFAKIGKWSLSIYLSHIGIVSLLITSSSSKDIVVFLIATIIVSFFAELLSIKITKLIK